MDTKGVKVMMDPRRLAQMGMALISSAESRIGNGVALVLIALAAVADLLTLIPLVGDAVGPLFWTGISYYLWRKGCGFVKVSRLVTEAISMIAEMIPAIQELPTIIIGMIIVVALIRLEDRTGISIMKPLSKGRRDPLNRAGVRLARDIDEEDRQSRNPNMQPLNIGGVRQPSA